MSVDSNILHMYHIHTQLFNGPLSRTTRVPTHNHDEEKGFTQSTRVHSTWQLDCFTVL